MDFKFGEKEEKLRAEVRAFARAELSGRHVVSGLEEESRDEDWEFTMSISRKLSQKGWLDHGLAERVRGPVRLAP